jgi:membrane associated rhomboid family serine protease
MFPIRDTIPSRHPPIATWVLILINGVVFLFELTMPEPALEPFFGYPFNAGHAAPSMTCREGLTTLPGHGQFADL